MRFSHNKKQFNLQIKKKENFVFFKKVKLVKDDPIPGFIQTVEDNPYSFLYESVEKRKEKGRFSICGYQSIKTLTLKNKKKLEIKTTKKRKIIIISNNPLDKIDEIIKKDNFIKYKNLPPMAGSFFGYLSYENIHNVEIIKKFKKINKLRTPELILFVPKNLIIFDNLDNSLYFIRHFLGENNETIKYEKMIRDVNKIQNKIIKNIKLDPINFDKGMKMKVKSNMTKTKFIKNIKKAKNYIKNGDIFQVVPSQRFEVDFDAKGSSLYRVLRETNPSPFMYYFNLPDFQIVGSSPEILVRLRNNTITIRPIAGTRPRGINKKQDKKFEIDLMSDRKELAEHLMLLDLGRNDVGKVSRKSSVSVTAKFIVEKYSHVMHIVSNVIGKLKKDISPITALMAGFPAGTVSGAPKIRAMQIIDELETDYRGIYSGGIGYISPDGDMDTCIVLRTGIITKKKLYVQAGGGVVYDSNPEYEYLETVNKAKAVLTAASIVLGNKK